MPQHKGLLTLKSVCLLNLAKNMDNIWCADYSNHFLDQGNYLYLLGPFDCLTPEFIQGLINILVETKLMKRYYLHLLIDNRLERLDLSVCKIIANKDSIMNLVTARCQKLTELNIATFNQVSARVLTDLVDSLPNIRYLNLRQTKCTDQVLARLGTSCRDLRELNLLGCPVTDMGVMSLCVSFNPSQPKCSKLQTLDLQSTSVTSKGIQIAITNLKNLQYLYYPDICEALYRMHHSHKQGEEVAEIQQYNLRYLSCSVREANLAPVSDSVAVACAFCPKVTEVQMTHGVTNQSVLYLCSFQHLKTLLIANSDEEFVTFENGLLSVLQIRGQLIQELSLYEINHLDISAIGACCPNLEKFTCLIAGYSSAQFPINSHPELLMNMLHKPYSKLKLLKVLLHTPTNRFSSQSLRALTFNSPFLEEIHFAFVQCLTDEALNNLIKVNPLSHVEKVFLESCDHVTGEAILTAFLQMPNCLKSLVLRNCKEIMRRDYENYQKLTRENNYDLYLEWS